MLLSNVLLIPTYWYAAAMRVAATPAPMSSSSARRRFLAWLLFACARAWSTLQFQSSLLRWRWHQALPHK